MIELRTNNSGRGEAYPECLRRSLQCALAFSSGTLFKPRAPLLDAKGLQVVSPGLVRAEEACPAAFTQ